MSRDSLPHHHTNEKKLEKLQLQLSKIDDFQIVAEIFKQLGDTTRIRIFWLLCHCEECVINISAMMNMSSPAVSHHLRPLKNRGLIVSRRVGKEVYYKAADTEQSQMLHQMIERAIEITCPKEQHSLHQFRQEELIRTIHDQLTAHLDQRITIEDLARQYLMNPTTLKTLFKDIYGDSIASHIKEHRMEAAASMLLETDDTIAQIARAVGYENQSKFTTAFKEFYQVLPTEYRKSPQLFSKKRKD